MAFRFALVVTIAAVMVADVAAQQPRTPPRDVLSGREPSGMGFIAGRIRSEESGRPLRAAFIRAVGPGGTRQVQTDDEGRFELEVQPGEWRVTVARGGYLTREYGQSNSSARGSSITVSPQQRATIELSLTRASAIGGRVYDEYGEPIAQARVRVLRPRMVRHRRYLEPLSQSDVTDDTGTFRVYGLPPGEYYVTASALLGPPGTAGDSTLAPTFYPGTGDFVQAKKVALAPGTDARIEFPLIPVPTARVSGSVISASGRRNAFVTLSSEAGDLGTIPRVTGATREDGSFSLIDVPPGTYTLIAEVRTGTDIIEIGSGIVNVEGADLEGITVATAKPGTLRGTIVADAGVSRPLPAAFDLYAFPRWPATDNTFTTSRGSSFELNAPPGPFTIEAAVPEGWMVKSITIGGIEATELAIDIGREESVPVTVVLTDRLTDLMGTVTGDNAAGSFVVVFPADSSNWTPRRIRTSRADSRGRFRIGGLPPGERYLAVAVDRLETGEEDDPDFLHKVQAQGTAFDLAAEVRQTVTVKAVKR